MALELVKVSKSDLESIMKWRMKPEVTEYMYTNPTLTIKTQSEWFDRITEDVSSKYWIIKFDNVKIGLINICDIDYSNMRCSWAYYIGDTSFRGRGIATMLECNMYDFVFDVLGLNKLCCEVFESNDKVISIHEKFGTLVEGRLKQHIRKNGEYYDVVAMAITKDRWSKIKENYSYVKIAIEK